MTAWIGLILGGIPTMCEKIPRKPCIAQRLSYLSTRVKYAHDFGKPHEVHITYQISCLCRGLGLLSVAAAIFGQYRPKLYRFRAVSPPRWPQISEARQNVMTVNRARVFGSAISTTFTKSTERMNEMRKLLLTLGLGLALATGAANAATINGGETTVTVTAPLTTLGLGGAPFGTATATGATFTFPITGGSTAGGGLEILHDGSGVTLFTLDTTDDVEVTVGNFVIDTLAETVFGDVIGGPTGLDLFSFGTAQGGIGLEITGTLAGALTSIFNAPDLTGAQFGVANTSPEIAPVPLPASALLLLAGFGMFGVVKARRQPS
ncbi:VPLPA-CTERM sorting domain-containing protein [uncultured Roseobacter sp.]|uniref:VPLPA-CTERM sorting domain-containing protein n=1 Tax=uncultured Roseobacter sp. TaxID=114847 RepID=UPI0026057E7B|nr:VPLPA-CTERM sorting domain-containing protein [uncultured Roseobacter sp.]